MFESEMLKKRQAEGRNKARKNGVHIGRPETTKDQKEEIKKRRLKGQSVIEIAAAMNRGTSTVYKYLKG